MNTPVAPSAEELRSLSVGSGQLRISRLQLRSCALGPGTRAVIWFQGCSLDCPGCIAASMNAAPPRIHTTPALLAAWCTSIPGINGITLSGGDPFDQPLEALAEFLELVRANSRLSMLAYTGRTLSQLRRHHDPALARCLGAIDILIDGPYVQALNGGEGWRGSSNQEIRVLGDRAEIAVGHHPPPRRMELIVDGEGGVSLTGIPGRGMSAALVDGLAGCCDGDPPQQFPMTHRRTA